MTEQTYFPPPESQGGWRYVEDPDAAVSLTGMDLEKLDQIRENQEWLYGGDSWSIAIFRRGYLVREFYTFNVLVPTRFDIWSCTKSFTGTAWGLLIDDSREGRLHEGRVVDFDTPAYGHIQEGHPLTDPRKEQITFRHLLTMTSGIPGENAGVVGMPTGTTVGPFEHALGRSPNRFGRWADKLAGDPGMVWDYSDPAMAHLALAFSNLTDREMDDYLQERVLSPIGIENFSWDVQGGSGFLGPHTNAHTGVHISARELARFGYLMLHKGQWADRQILPLWWVELATQSSQDLNPDYGYTWWVNTTGTQWPGLPRDAFAASGYRMNKCYVVPSLDLVIVRTGSGPVGWNEAGFLQGIIQAILD